MVPTRTRPLAADGVESEGLAWWVSAERVPEVLAVAGPEVRLEPALTPPADLAAREWSREDAIRELVRGRLQMCGPVTADEMAHALAVGAPEVEAALLALEGEGFVLRGAFTSPDAGVEWCERRLLARIHRYTLNRLRAEIRPVSQADFMRFLFAWQRGRRGRAGGGGWRGWPACSRSSRDSRPARARGRRTCSAGGSRATTRGCWTPSAWRAASPGRASPRRRATVPRCAARFPPPRSPSWTAAAWRCGCAPLRVLLRSAPTP